MWLSCSGVLDPESGFKWASVMNSWKISVWCNGFWEARVRSLGGNQGFLYWLEQQTAIAVNCKVPTLRLCRRIGAVVLNKIMKALWLPFKGYRSRHRTIESAGSEENCPHLMEIQKCILPECFVWAVNGTLSKCLPYRPGQTCGDGQRQQSVVCRNSELVRLLLLSCQVPICMVSGGRVCTPLWSNISFSDLKTLPITVRLENKSMLFLSPRGLNPYPQLPRRKIVSIKSSISFYTFCSTGLVFAIEECFGMFSLL